MPLRCIDRMCGLLAVVAGIIALGLSAASLDKPMNILYADYTPVSGDGESYSDVPVLVYGMQDVTINPNNYTFLPPTKEMSWDDFDDLVCGGGDDDDTPCDDTDAAQFMFMLAYYFLIVACCVHPLVACCGLVAWQTPIMEQHRRNFVWCTAISAKLPALLTFVAIVGTWSTADNSLELIAADADFEGVESAGTGSGLTEGHSILIAAVFFAATVVCAHVTVLMFCQPRTNLDRRLMGMQPGPTSQAVWSQPAQPAPRQYEAPQWPGSQEQPPPYNPGMASQQQQYGAPPPYGAPQQPMYGGGPAQSKGNYV